MTYSYSYLDNLLEQREERLSARRLIVKAKVDSFTHPDFSTQNYWGYVKEAEDELWDLRYELDAVREQRDFLRFLFEKD